MANFILALVNAELSLFGVATANDPVTASAAETPGSTTAFDSEHYRSALG
ncbi:hypothetical protein RAS12_27965 [Achromobacter seleniivolatilans]|uniref:Uncharacterized protein n=1 Tax=Achromobacter seleniivolatilans TaxID=3047478 RepID=A0ABY9M2H6_9BURK|nr:hypothetical protein [Achromobacter sp. R39]WMD20398.1 hypothetical protein RAS12_27965 [Achromobacter sp. R39]